MLVTLQGWPGAVKDDDTTTLIGRNCFWCWYRRRAFEDLSVVVIAMQEGQGVALSVGNISMFVGAETGQLIQDATYCTGSLMTCSRGPASVWFN